MSLCVTESGKGGIPMTRREKVLSVTALLMIWFGAGYHFWYQPLAQQIQAVEQQIKTAESEGWPKELQSNADQLANRLI